MKLSSHQAPTHEFDEQQVERAIANNGASIEQFLEARTDRDALRAEVQAAMEKCGWGVKQK